VGTNPAAHLGIGWRRIPACAHNRQRTIGAMRRSVLLAANIMMAVFCVLAGRGQQAGDPADVYRQSKERLLADLGRMPHYTCIETITRRYYAAPTHLGQRSCSQFIAEHEKRTHELSLQSWDRLRLDIAVGSGQEIYSWVGAPRFDEATLAAVAGNGPLGSGDFGPYIGAIFGESEVKFQGEKLVSGRRLLEYSFEIPESRSQYKVKAKQNWFTTAYGGTFLLDPDALDLTHLTVRTAELPAETEQCQAISEVEYERAPIHGHLALIPHESRLRLIGRNGEENLNIDSYANCREYTSKSVLRFDAPENPAEDGAPTAPLAGQSVVIPAGRRFDFRVVTPIDSDTAAAGDPVEAVLRSAIRDKKEAIIVPVGARIHGRLAQFEQEIGPRNFFQLGLKLESIDVNGTRAPFRAKLQRESPFMYYRSYRQPPAPASEVGSFIFLENHLKRQHLDSSGTTMCSEASQKEESQPATR
jgi:hypothetical protein